MNLRQHKKHGTWYIWRGRTLKSLNTKDEKIAREKFAIIQKSSELIDVYRMIVADQQRALAEIENHYSRIADIVNSDGSRKDRPRQFFFESEQDMQFKLTTTLINDFGFKDLVQYKECDVGIVDAFGYYDGEPTAIEFKLGSIRERYLGQCLRYLGDDSLGAKKLWLIGEDLDTSASIFKKFQDIAVFVTTKSVRAKCLIAPRLNFRPRAFSKPPTGEAVAKVSESY